MENLESKFWDYRKKVIPPSAPDVQVIECQRAFFAGSKATYDMLVEIGSLTEEQAEAAINDLEHSLCSFVDDVENGGA